MSRLRLCTLKFVKTIKAEINGRDEDFRKDRTINIVLLGVSGDSVYGIFSEQIENVDLVKRNIDILEEQTVEKRFNWFQKYFPKAPVLKIKDELVYDQILEPKSEKRLNHSVAIVSSADLVWSS